MPTLSRPRLTRLRLLLWPEGGAPWRSEPGPWSARLMLGVILAITLAINATYLQHNPFPRPSSHRTWRLVPEMMQHFMGYGHHSPGGPGTTFLGGMGCYYSLGPRQPLPWTDPVGMWHELASGGRLFQLWGTCPNDFFTCMPHAFAVPAAVGAAFPGHFLLVALVPTFYFLALLAAMYGIGVEVAGRRTGLAAAAIAAGYPGLFGFARWPEGYMAATALSTVMVWLLLRSRGLTRIGPVLGFTVLAWSAIRNGEGMAEASAAGLAVSGPFLVELIRGVATALRARKVPWRTLLGLTLVLGLLAVSMDWRWIDGSLFQTFDGFTEFGMDARPRGPSPSPTATLLASRGVYLLMLWADYLKPLLAAWAIAGLLLVLIGRPRHAITLLLWFLIPFLGCSSMARKALVYAVPMVPPLAAITAAGLASLRWPRVRLAALVLAGTCGLYQLVALSSLPMAPHLASPPWMHGPRTPNLVEVRWYDLLFSGDETTRAMQHDADAFLTWLDASVPRSDTLKQVGVLTPWGDDTQPALQLRWYLSLHRPDLSVVELAERRYVEQNYPQLYPNDFAFLIRSDVSGHFLPWDLTAQGPVPTNPDRNEPPPPALTRMVHDLLSRARGTAPGVPPVLILSFPETRDLAVEQLR